MAVMLVLLATGAGLVALSARSGAAATWPGCDSFDTQPEAQKYWESHGRPAEADGDSDGKVCESLPDEKRNKDDCRRPGKPVTVRLSPRTLPGVDAALPGRLEAGGAAAVHDRPEAG